MPAASPPPSHRHSSCLNAGADAPTFRGDSLAIANSAGRHTDLLVSASGVTPLSPLASLLVDETLALRRDPPSSSTATRGLRPKSRPDLLLHSSSSATPPKLILRQLGLLAHLLSCRRTLDLDVLPLDHLHYLVETLVSLALVFDPLLVQVVDTSGELSTNALLVAPALVAEICAADLQLARAGSWVAWTLAQHAVLLAVSLVLLVYRR